MKSALAARAREGVDHDALGNLVPADTGNQTGCCKAAQAEESWKQAGQKTRDTKEIRNSVGETVRERMRPMFK